MATEIQRGESILINAGCDHVFGLAAIRVALAYGLNVFTTVGTEEEKLFLLNEFPGLKKENIGNTQDLSFERLIMLRMNGKGVDYVLNSSSEEKLQALIRCLGKAGKFLQIGEFDPTNGTWIELDNLLNGISFHTILVERLLKAPETEKVRINNFRVNQDSKYHFQGLRSLIEKDIRTGIVKPLQKVIFDANQIEQAFQFLAKGQHIRKVLLKVRDQEECFETLPITVMPRVYFPPNLSCIILGGLGGFGLELADWLVLRGCRKLVLSSRRGITKQYQAYRIK